MWNEINTQSDLENFMYIHREFHDSCIKELKYISGAYCNGKSMYPINDLRILDVIVQGNFVNSHVIEMEFIGLIHLNFFPIEETYTCEIFDSTMLLKDDCIYWLDEGGWKESDFDNYKGTLICASKMRWRTVDKYIGSEEVYIERDRKAAD